VFYLRRRGQVKRSTIGQISIMSSQDGYAGCERPGKLPEPCLNPPAFRWAHRRNVELQNHSLGPMAHFPIVPQTYKAICGDNANRGGFEDEKYGTHKLFLMPNRAYRAR